MKVFLTGATGFVGAHTALALLDAGHELRLLVRNPDRLNRYLSPFGYQVDDLVVADMREADVIAEGMQGCDAVLHAAAAVSLDPRKAEETYHNNFQGMKNVIGEACEQGIGNIVYVSSLSVVMQPGPEEINERTPLADTQEAYSRSKRDSDEYVRELQSQGHPVQITYPSAIIGPDDPGLSEANHALVRFLSQMIPNTTSGFQCVDVRDLAESHVYLLEHPVTADFQNARYIIGGHHYRWPEIRAHLEAVTGRCLLSPYIPGAVFRVLGAVTDLCKKIIPFETPVSSEAMGYVTQWVPASSEKYLNHSGLAFRTPEQTFTDSLSWMLDAGHLKPKYAARLASQS